MGIEPASSLQAIVFATLFSAVVSMPEEAILLEFGVSQKALVDNFQLGTETALGRANIIRTTKIETLQAFIMYLVGRFWIYQEFFLLISDLKYSSCLIRSLACKRLTILTVILHLHILDSNPLVHYRF